MSLIFSPRPRFLSWFGFPFVSLLCLGGAAPARGAVVVVDDFIGTPLGTRTVVAGTSPSSSTTASGTFTESGGVATMVVGGGGNGVGTVTLTWNFPAKDLTDAGNNAQFFLEFPTLQRASGNPGDPALDVTVYATDKFGTQGIYSTGVSSQSPFNLVFNFNCAGGGVCFTPNPDWTKITQVQVYIAFPGNYTYTTTCYAPGPLDTRLCHAASF